jgi:hypothetical protein
MFQYFDFSFANILKISTMKFNHDENQKILIYEQNMSNLKILVIIR